MKFHQQFVMMLVCALVGFGLPAGGSAETTVKRGVDAELKPFDKILRDWSERDFERGIEARELIDQLRLQFPTKQDQEFLDGYLVKKGISPASVFKVKDWENLENSVEITLQSGRKIVVSRFTPEAIDLNGKTLKIKGLFVGKYLSGVRGILRATHVASGLRDLILPPAFADGWSDLAHGSMVAHLFGKDSVSVFRKAVFACKKEFKQGVGYDQSRTKRVRESAEKHEGPLAEVFQAVFPSSPSTCQMNCTKFAGLSKNKVNEFQVDPGRKEICDLVSEFRACAEAVSEGDGASGNRPAIIK